MECRRIFVTCSVLTVTTLATLWWWCRNRKQKIPTQWKAVGKVSDLHIYPLKSGYRVELKEGICTKFGLEQITDKAVYTLKDRFLIVYQGTHFEFRTARTHPKMVLIEVSNHDPDHVALDAPNMRRLYVKIPKITEANVFKVTMHQKEPTDLVDCGEEAAAWLSRYILDSDSGVRLGFKDTNLKSRTINRKFPNQHHRFYPNITDNDLGIFSDLTSFMLMTKRSVKDLNSRLEKDVTFTQFRPTILVDGVDLPYIEDNWNWIKIGNEAVFQNVKPCTRCALTTVHSETGVKDTDHEPLKTLKTYRQLDNEEQRKAEGNSPVLGIHLGLRKPGILRVNDIVYIG